MIDLPPDPPLQHAPIVIVQARQAQNKDAKTDRTIGVCHLIENQPDAPPTAKNSVNMAGAVWGYLKRQEHHVIDAAGFKAAKATLLQAPEHGVLDMGTSGGYYQPKPDYFGSDRATALVEMGGFKVKVMYFFKVMEGVGGGNEREKPYDDKSLCPQGRVWKISLNTK